MNLYPKIELFSEIFQFRMSKKIILYKSDLCCGVEFSMNFNFDVFFWGSFL